MWCAVRTEQAAAVGVAPKIAEEMDGGGGVAKPVPPDANVEGDDRVRAEGLMREVLSKLVDLRGVARPPLFTGAVEDWSEFRFRMENVASLLGLEDFMEKAVRGEGEEEPGDATRSKFLYNLLVTICQGKALALVRLVPRHDGVRAWASLVREYEPDEASRHCAVLAGLMSPEWRTDTPFADQLLAWEKKVTEYEAATDPIVPDRFRCAIVLKWAPPRVQELLRLTPEAFTRNYALLRSALQTYQARGRTYDASGCLQGSEGALPMEVDALKGKGKGKGGQPTQRACFKCGQLGHMKRDCRNPPAQGGGKGGKNSGKGGKGGGEEDRQQVLCRKCGKVGHRAAECRGGAGKGGKGGGRGGQTTATTMRSTFTGVCWKCSTPGHRAADCRRVLALDAEIEEAPVQTIAAMNPWLLNIDDMEVDAVGESGSRAMLLVDSGAYAHVCPTDFARHVPVEESQGTTIAMAADGRGMEMYGKKEVGLMLEDGRPARVVFQVMNMRRPILSVAALRSHGIEVHFTASGAYLARDGYHCPLTERGNLYYLPVELARDPTVQVIAPELTGPWLLLEWCCEANSRLARWFKDQGHAALRLCLHRWGIRRTDIVNTVVVRVAEAARMGFRPMIWASLPCTPWSQWQQVNTTLSTATMERIQKERYESLCMVWQLARAVQQLRKMDVVVELAFEWPRTASGWRHPDIKKLLDDMKLEYECNFDGCRYQLKDADGLPVMEQWRVRTTLEVAGALEPPL